MGPPGLGASSREDGRSSARGRHAVLSREVNVDLATVWLQGRSAVCGGPLLCAWACHAGHPASQGSLTEPTCSGLWSCWDHRCQPGLYGHVALSSLTEPFTQLLLATCCCLSVLWWEHKHNSTGSLPLASSCSRVWEGEAPWGRSPSPLVQGAARPVGTPGAGCS